MFNKKKKYFRRKIEAIQKQIWDSEFKRDKALQIREEVRREYDATCSKQHVIITKIESQLENPKQTCDVHNPEQGKEKIHKDKGTCVCNYIKNHMKVADIETLYDQKELLQVDITRYEAQMKKIDLDVHGSKKTNEYPDGLDGVDQTLEYLRELLIMAKDYLKKI